MKRNGRGRILGIALCSAVTCCIALNRAAAQAPVIFSEYYESAPGNRKALEIYNTSASPVTLTDHVLARYSNANTSPDATAALDSVTIPAFGVVVIINNVTDDIPNFDESTGIALPTVMTFNGDDAMAIIYSPTDTVIDRFAVPGQQDSGPRLADPYADSAWERDCAVTSGTADFDACNFDGLKDCASPPCPPGTPVGGSCADGAHANEWIFEGRNLSGNNGNHTLGVHNCVGDPVGACCPGAGRGVACCPGDLNADQVVDFADVSPFVAALLNNVYDPCADMQGDNADNGADIQAFVAAVLAETPCASDCVEVTEAECDGLGGIYQGDGSVCGPETCIPAVTGACCTTDGCVESLSEAQCATEGGLYFGDDSVCAGQDCMPDNSTVVINEIRLDQTGGDADEYFELAGPPGALLTGLTYVIIGDDSGTQTVPGDRSGNIERAISLDGQVIPADGRFLAATGTFTLNGATPDFIFDANGSGAGVFENSDNVTHMLVRGFTGSADTLIDDDRDGTPNATLPWTAIQDWVSIRETNNPPPALGDEWVYDFSPAPGVIVGPDGAFAPGHVYRNDPNTNTDGPGTPWQIGPFDPSNGDDTPGLINVISGACCTDGTCAVLTRDDCTLAGGIYKGTGTDCTVNPCVGACCVGSTCTIQTPVDCQNVSGIYSGDGSSCTPNPCAQVCATIPGARSIPVGSPVRVCGVLSSTTDLNGPGNISIQLQDNNGPGGQTAISIFGSDAVVGAILAGASLGDSVELVATQGEFNGLLQLVDGSTPLQLVSNNGFVGAPAPIEVTVTDFQNASPTAEDLESEIVRVECVQFVDGNGSNIFQGGTNYAVTDGEQIMFARVAHDGLDIAFNLIPVGPVNLTGIFSQFDSSALPRDGGYQLLLRTLNDIEQVEPGDPNCLIPTGACCHFEGCTVTTAADCVQNLFGTYIGDDISCEFGCPSDDASCIIISEVVDGDRVGGTPKWIEITNTGSSLYQFPAGGIVVQSNNSTALGVTIDLTGVILVPGQPFVVADTNLDGQNIFQDTYDATFPGGPVIADLYVFGIQGNGDDRYALTDTPDASNIIDVYGELGVDGSGTPWEYTDSVAVRNPGASSPNGGVFNVADWTITSVNDTVDAVQKQLLQQHTTPGTHTHDPCAAQACVEPPLTRSIAHCGGGGEPSCAVQNYCSNTVDASEFNPNLPANCARCTAIDGQTVCVPCVSSCPSGETQIFRWVNFDGQGNDCYFEGTIFTPGGCQAGGPCFETAGQFNDVP